VKEKFHYSVKLQLFDNRMNLGITKLVAVHRYYK